jgi:hypothetical protein
MQCQSRELYFQCGDEIGVSVMWKNAITLGLVMMLVTTFLSLPGCEFGPESTFELAGESRLPKWFTLPAGLSRSDVTVTAYYYVKSSGRTSKFIMHDQKRQKLAEVTGISKGSEPLKLKRHRDNASSPYPMYEVVTANGITEIIEHRRMEPKFYVTDDPAVLEEIGRP